MSSGSDVSLRSAGFCVGLFLQHLFTSFASTILQRDPPKKIIGTQKKSLIWNLFLKSLISKN